MASVSRKDATELTGGSRDEGRGGEYSLGETDRQA